MTRDLDRQDEIDKLVSQAQAVAYLMSAGSPELHDLHQRHLSNAAWLLRDMLDRIRDLALKRGR